MSGAADDRESAAYEVTLRYRELRRLERGAARPGDYPPRAEGQPQDCASGGIAEGGD